MHNQKYKKLYTEIMHRYYAQKLLAEIISRNYVFTCKEYCDVKSINEN